MPLVALTFVPAAAAKGRASCSFEEDYFNRAPATIADPPEPSLLASYARLRRPATPRDQPPPINSLGDQLSFELGRYNPAYIRQLTERPGGRRFFLVPGFPVHVTIPPARCLPAKLRPKRPKLVVDQLERERQPIACVATISPSGRSSRGMLGPSFADYYGAGFGAGWTAYAPISGCPRFRDVTKYENLSSGILFGTEQAGILPDGIAAVRAHFRHLPTVQVPVVENFYLYKVDPLQRKKLLHQLRLTITRLARSHAHTKAQRRTLERRYRAAQRRFVDELSPTNVELLAPDSHLVQNVRRSPKDLGGYGLPLAAPSSSAAAGGEFARFCALNPGAC